VHREHRAVVQKLYDARARDLIDLEHGQRVVERQLALGHQVVNGDQYRHFDQARGRERFVTAAADAGAGLEIDDAVANYSVMSVGD